MLSNLLAVKIELCDSRFELQINDVRFIGHPKIMDTSKKTSLQMFHLVFAVRVSRYPYSNLQFIPVNLIFCAS